jgi:hypothetical protein
VVDGEKSNCGSERVVNLLQVVNLDDLALAKRRMKEVTK